MVITIIAIWCTIGAITWASATAHETYKRQDKIIKWINEAIKSKDLPRDEWPLLEEQRYSFIAFFKALVITMVLWPVVINKKLSGW